MGQNDYDSITQSIQELDKKVSRILRWAEGDPELGDPSISDRMNGFGKRISETRDIAFKNNEEIGLIKKDVTELKEDTRANTNDIKNFNAETKKTSTIFGAGSGGAFTLLIQAIKSAIQ